MQDSKLVKCQNCNSGFTVEPGDFKFYAKMNVPPPTFCPECRLIRRLSFRNERYLYKRNCDLCGKEMISIFAPEKKYKVYCQEDWWSDKWDALNYGREYDFSKPFFEQFGELMREVPSMTLESNYTTLENSEYVHKAGFAKNCYLISEADYNEDCCYGSSLKFSKDCIDVTIVQNSEICYECLNITRGYQNFYSADCENCYNIYFSKNLLGCSDCFGCVNLRRKSYHIFNKPYTKEEYLKRLKEFNLGSYHGIQQLKEEAHKFWKEFPGRYYHGIHNRNVSGDYIYQSKNVFYSYAIIGGEDLKYCQFLTSKPIAESYDFTEWGHGASFIYESCGSGDGNNLKFTWAVFTDTYNVEYCMQCIYCQNVFCSIGLRHKKYCILNKQYSKTEYEALRQKIIAQMNAMPYTDKKGRTYRYGEFFPFELSPFGYNETALEFFPLSAEAAAKAGYNWREGEKREWVKSGYETPDHIKDVKDDILNAILTCITCEKNYRIIKPELAFYRKFEIPVPRKCHDCRHFERVKWRSPMRLSLRQCGKCGKGVKANITQEISPIIYCEECWVREVI
ncbi:MAG: hypothetical protein HYZ69_02095 [Candidatus Colwellbacteria bacterium]|nr:hypothetical protein [Candidatus Colwellbacteria bacterium]